jgi:bifunctional NMN adenylyltransferase/nudix hydrolase
MSKNLIVLIGSSGQAKTIKNPWSFAEREQMIQQTCPGMNIITAPLYDKKYNDQAWVSQVQDIISFIIADKIKLNREPKIALVGHFKDDSSYYLHMFPQWDLVSVENWDNLDATSIRKVYFSCPDTWNAKAYSTTSVGTAISDTTVSIMRNNPSYVQLQKEFNYIQAYRKSWEAAPYPPTFVTADAIVIKSGHILLVKRGRELGVGLWAMPGGFVNQNERIEDAAVRELREETKLRIPVPFLHAAIKKVTVFDPPWRSERGRIITHVHLIELPPDDEGLPKVKGSDDADKAAWIPISQLSKMEDKMFEDHYYIIKALLGME